MFKEKKIAFFFVFMIALFNATLANSGEINLNDVDKPIVKKELDPKNTLYIELKNGIVVVELFPKIAPMHVQRIRTLTAEGFYDDVKFHRVISNFMAQTGDPTGTGRGGSKLGKLYAEFNAEHHTRGTLSMARASDPNSANSQFFIVTGEFFPELDNQYTIFGRVIEGMDYIDKIKAGDTAKNGIVENPDVMIKVVTGDMLNNKSLETIKEEIKVINEMQDQKLKEDSKYQKKSILELLLKTKDIDITKNTEDNSQTQNNLEKTNDVKTEEIKQNSSENQTKIEQTPSNMNSDVNNKVNKEPVKTKENNQTKMENGFNESDFNSDEIPVPFEENN